VLPLVAVVIVTNAAMLAFAWANRTSTTSALRVTERELYPDLMSDRDSSVRLRLRHVRPAEYRDWLDAAKLTSLGLTCRSRTGGPPIGAGCGLPRRAFVALEFDGPAWQEVIARRTEERDALLRKSSDTNSYDRSAARQLDDLIRVGTRLVAIDASLDAAALRQAHPDERVIILPAIVRAWLAIPPGAASPPVMAGTIDPVTTAIVLSVGGAQWFRTNLASRYRGDGSPRYSVDLVVGRRYEPWVRSVQPIDSREPAR